MASAQAGASTGRVTPSLDELRPLVEERQHGLPPLGRQEEEGPGCSRLAEEIELCLLGWRRKDGHGDRLHVPALPGRDLPQLLVGVQSDLGAAAARKPAVAEIDHALQRVLALAAEQDGRMWLLGRLGPRPAPVEVDMSAVELGLVLRPDLLEGPHLLLELPEAGLEVGAVVLHLLGVPATTDAEQEATVAEHVETGHRLGGGEGVALDDEADAGADLEVLGGGRRGHEGHERIVGALVLLGQRPPSREGAAPAGGDVGVLGDEERLELARLQLARQVVGPDGAISGENADANVHGEPPSSFHGVSRPVVGRGWGTSEKWVWRASHRPSRRVKTMVS